MSRKRTWFISAAAVVLSTVVVLWLMLSGSPLLAPSPERATPTPPPTPTPISPTATLAPATPTATLAPATPTATLAPATPTVPAQEGRLEVTYPLKMKVEEADTVTAEIIVDPRLAQIGVYTHHITGIIETSHSEGRERIEERIRLFPVMSAELISGHFEITSGDINPRRIAGGQSMAWTWTMIAKKPGIQQFTIKIFGEMTYDGDTYSTLERSITKEIEVLNKPLPARAVDYLGENIAIIGTGGPIGLILAFLTYRANQANKELRRRIEELEGRMKELEKTETTDEQGDGETG